MRWPAEGQPPEGPSVRAASSAAVEVPRLLVDVETAAEAGEKRLLQGNLTAEGIDGGDAKLRGKLCYIPAEGAGAGEGTPGQYVH